MYAACIQMYRLAPVLCISQTDKSSTSKLEAEMLHYRQRIGSWGVAEYAPLMKRVKSCYGWDLGGSSLVVSLHFICRITIYLVHPNLGRLQLQWKPPLPAGRVNMRGRDQSFPLSVS
jgi:hypothetical protein